MQLNYNGKYSYGIKHVYTWYTANTHVEVSGLIEKFQLFFQHFRNNSYIEP